MKARARAATRAMHFTKKQKCSFLFLMIPDDSLGFLLIPYDSLGFLTNPQDSQDSLRFLAAVNADMLGDGRADVSTRGADINTIQYKTIQYNAMQRNPIQCNAMQ